MDGSAIVVIPSKDDYVWNVSSEKVPHLTLLFLNDLSNSPDLKRIEDYISHVVETSMKQFSLSVIRRGTLGPQDADVLFFNDTRAKLLEEIRSYLLKDEKIFTAYSSIPQYPEFTPHLTLGYPTAPAKPDTREYPGIGYVHFDRVGFWTGNYTGPEFELKDNDDLMAGAMNSDIDAVLAHFGVRGMKWGVHKLPRVSDADLARYEKLAKSAGDIRRDPTKAKIGQQVKTTGGLHKVTDKELQTMLNRMDMERRYKQFMREDADRRREGAKSVLKILGEVGKIALPIILGAAAGTAAKNMGGVYRTTATVAKRAITAR